MKWGRVGGVSLAVLMFTSSLLAQGINTPIVKLDLPGNWQEQPEWVAHVNLPEKFAFYEQSSGSILHIRRTQLPWKVEALDKVIEQLKATETRLTERPGFARFLASAYFLFPVDYVKEVARVFDPAPVIVGQAARILAYKSPERSGAGRSKAPRMWEVKKVRGDAEWFYVSQLTPGFVTKRLNGGLATEEAYAPVQLTRGERRSVGPGEALIFEMETKQPAGERAVKNFSMPATVKGQRIRYGWVLYSRDRFGDTTEVITIAFGTPLNSGVSCEAILAALQSRLGKEAGTPE